MLHPQRRTHGAATIIRSVRARHYCFPRLHTYSSKGTFDLHTFLLHFGSTPSSSTLGPHLPPFLHLTLLLPQGWGGGAPKQVPDDDSPGAPGRAASSSATAAFFCPAPAPAPAPARMLRQQLLPPRQLPAHPECRSPGSAALKARHYLCWGITISAALTPWPLPHCHCRVERRLCVRRVSGASG